jgi:23S rRNA (uracil1939-C5)-methyltransferase
MQVQRVSVAKADGKVVFIPNVVPGDVIDVQTLKVLLWRQFIFMNIQNTVPNLYEHFGVCGGCKWQNKYSQQYYKQNEVLNHLQRIGKSRTSWFWANLRFRKTVFYRNKMEFSFQTAG